MTWALAIVAILWVGYALLARRWRIEPLLDGPQHAPFAALVVAIVPARNEAGELPHTLPSLLGQSHPHLKVVLIDDHSTDGTAEVAHRLANERDSANRLIVLRAAELPAEWTGKVWAQHQGVEHAKALGAQWLWFTDADIRHDHDVLQRLLTTAEFRRRDFVSVMARLRCTTAFEKLLIPAFTYFFAGLYSFARIGDDSTTTGGAAGGCMLVRASVLEAAGGVAAIRNAVIDDVALGSACKRGGGRLWLGYHDGVRSLRGYDTLDSIWRMVARSAYTQLSYSPLALIGCVLGLAYMFVVPVYALVFTCGWSRFWALIAYTAMVRTYYPMVTYLGAPARWAMLLPLAAALYTGMTITSAWRYHAGAGNTWKGRAYDKL